MRPVRLFVDSPLQQGRTVELDAALTNKIAKTLRLKPGAPLVLFSGDGLDHEAVLLDIQRHRCRAEIRSSLPRDRESPLRISLAQGLARSDKMDLALQKAVELGVACFQPLHTERSVVKLSESRAKRRQDHWRAIASAACEQCGRSRLPVVQPPLPIGDFLAGAIPGAKYLLAAKAARPLVPPTSPPENMVTVLIGPEGGLTETEQGAAREAGFSPLRLGPRVLRTETAAIAALTLFQYWWGDLGG